MTRRYLLNHAFQYLVILLLLMSGIRVIFSSTERLWKLLVILSLSLLYVIWGLWHHWEDHEKTTLATLTEYLLVAVLILWILLAVS